MSNKFGSTDFEYRHAADYRRYYGNNIFKKFDKTPFNKIVGQIIKESKAKATAMGKPELFFVGGPQDAIAIKFAGGVGIMEKVDIQLEKMGDVILDAVKRLEDGYNDLTKMHELIEPRMLEMIKNIRLHSGTIAREHNKALQSMKEVRKFFLSNEHKEEIKRLKDFIELVQLMGDLIENGTMEAICDVILKLEVKGG
jgi:hypothetical protein